MITVIFNHIFRVTFSINLFWVWQKMWGYIILKYLSRWWIVRLLFCLRISSSWSFCKQLFVIYTLSHFYDIKLFCRRFKYSFFQPLFHKCSTFSSVNRTACSEIMAYLDNLSTSVWSLLFIVRYDFSTFHWLPKKLVHCYLALDSK